MFDVRCLLAIYRSSMFVLYSSLVGRGVNVANRNALAEKVNLAGVLREVITARFESGMDSARWSVRSSSTPNWISTDAGSVLLNM